MLVCTSEGREPKMTARSLLCSCCLRTIWTPEEIDQHARSLQIDKQISKDRSKYRRQVKLLLLGAGESGKSTFLKQMRIIHGYHFTPEELAEFRLIIYRNVVQGMKVLCDAREKLGLTWSDPDNQQLATQILAVTPSVTVTDTQSFLPHVQPVKQLWKDAAIKTAYSRRAEYQLIDSVAYFFDNLDRISTLDYRASDADVVHARRATKSITEFSMTINNVPFLFVDVGGQRTQRQKWFQCFRSVTSILFLASTSEYDQRLLEDRSMNRLQESLNIFCTIVNNWNFREVSVILFLNKTDLLIQKVRSRQSNIAHYFSDFVGNGHDERQVQQFILNKFVEGRRPDFERQPLFHHFTTAVDTQNISIVFASVKDTILQRNLVTLMLQ
uniref:Guanine nucleotide-binding protein subunit alpha homolog n=1 Tax=Hirondellea gigas TaxID=1518452 RepID=A0A2P2IBY8_9CRUS